MKAKFKSTDELRTEAIVSAQNALADIALVTPEKIEPETSPALFSRINATLAHSVKIARVINMRAILHPTSKVVSACRYLASMQDTGMLTIDQIRSAVWKAEGSKSHSAKQDGKSVKYYTLSDLVSESDILKALFIMTVMTDGYHLTVNKNGLLSVQRANGKPSLLRGSVYVPYDYDDTDSASGESIKGRLTVLLNDSFKAEYLEAITNNTLEVFIKKCFEKPAPAIEAIEAPASEVTA